jgi:glycosyltransferase involved in cell wall biosynthesis
MRVLILHSTYRSGSASGENRVVEDEARLLSEGRHEVDVLTREVGDRSRLGTLSAGAGMVWSMDAVGEVKRRIDRSKPDIVHCHNLFPALSPAVFRVTEGIPTVVTLHNYRLLCLPGNFLREGRVCEDCLGRLPWPGILHGCYQSSRVASTALASSLLLHKAIRSFDRVDLWIAISDFVRRKHLEAGWSSRRTVVKPHFAWDVERREGPGDFFLFLGRLSPEKGVSTLLRVWNEVSAKLVIVGDGPDGERLRRIAPRNVEFQATVAPDRVPELLRHARAVVAPSVSHEGAGKVVLEAYAAGVPVLVSRAGGLPEVVHEGETGLVVATSEGAWVDAVGRLQDDAESERMGKAAWGLWAEKYTPHKGLQNLEDCYRRAAGCDL